MIRRPALIAAAAFAAGISAARFLDVPWTVWTVAAAVACIGSIIQLVYNRRKNGRERSFAPFIVPLLVLSGAAAYAVQDQVHTSGHILNFVDRNDSLRIDCRVTDEPRVNNGRTTMTVELLALSDGTDSIAAEGKAVLSIIAQRRTHERPLVPEYGAHLRFSAVLHAPPEERNPGEFSYRQYLALNNVYGQITVIGTKNITITDERTPNWFYEYLIYPSKEFVTRTIRTQMRGDREYFLTGLLLGDRTDLSDKIKTAFMNTGTIHVLAVSGSHVVLVAEIIFILLGMLRFSRRPKLIAAMFCLLYYMYLTGATPSVVRATLMVIILYIGKFFEEKTDVYNMLGASAVIIFLADPKQVFDVGFQLSFSAVLSIVFFYPRITEAVGEFREPFERLSLINPVWQLFAVSLAAQIGTLPFTAYYFGRVSIVSFFANLIVVPLVEIIVTIGFSGVLLGIVSLQIASVFSGVNDLIAQFALWFVHWAEKVPYAVVETATFGWRETLLYSVIVGMIFSIGQWQTMKRFLLAGMAAACLIVWFPRSQDHGLKITFLDVGQGDGAVIQCPNGQVIVVDAGPKTPEIDAGERTVAPYLRRSGIGRIDAVITTHPHADHLGGVPYLMRHFEIGETIDADQRARSALFTDYDRLEKEVPQVTARAGMILTFGDVRLYCIHPTPRFIDTDSSDGYSDLNQSSVVFKLCYGRTSVLFTGDAETEAEEQMLATYGDFLHADILKAGHHGSSTSSSEPFVTAIAPSHVVVSVAKFNKFRHPSKKVIQRFLDHGAVVHRTDEEGSVIVRSDGERITFEKWRDQ